jgi:hypothetical protein
MHSNARGNGLIDVLAAHLKANSTGGFFFFFFYTSLICISSCGFLRLHNLRLTRHFKSFSIYYIFLQSVLVLIVRSRLIPALSFIAVVTWCRTFSFCGEPCWRIHRLIELRAGYEYLLCNTNSLYCLSL